MTTHTHGPAGEHVIRWQDPPAPPVNRDARQTRAAQARELKATPGRWGLVYVGKHHQVTEWRREHPGMMVTSRRLAGGLVGTWAKWPSVKADDTDAPIPVGVAPNTPHARPDAPHPVESMIRTSPPRDVIVTTTEETRFAIQKPDASPRFHSVPAGTVVRFAGRRVLVRLSEPDQ